MTRSWKIGTAFGIGIYVHWSFLLLPLWVFFTTWGILGAPMVIYLLALMVAVFGCVVLHELGHALMARHFGIQTRDITLYPIGGVARLERMSDRPHEELLIAVAGPAVNVVLAGLLTVLVGFVGAVLGGAALVHSAMGGFLLSLLIANVFLVLFNLVPAFPMDGGRVLRALLSLPLGRLRATEIAVFLGAAISILLATGVLMASAGIVPWWLEWLRNPMLILIAGFVLFAGQQELMAMRRRYAARRAEPLDVLPAAAVVPVEERPAAQPVVPPVGVGFTGAVWDSRSRVWVLWHNGRPIASYGCFPSE
ncbi:MAG TPA: site-2 protease family protein [Gemmataceae bacterium]|jgi:Zn-dependent protease|nr:site-2 protease family protein [Gemmataceae bacterium]